MLRIAMLALVSAALLGGGVSCSRAKLELVSQRVAEEAEEAEEPAEALPVADDPSEPESTDAGVMLQISQFGLDKPRAQHPGSAELEPPSNPAPWWCDAGPCYPCSFGDGECAQEAPYCNVFQGACVQCTEHSQCLDDFGSVLPVCDPAQQECRRCVRDEECPLGWDCERGACLHVCDSDRDCPPDWDCDRNFCMNRRAG